MQDVHQSLYYRPREVNLGQISSTRYTTCESWINRRAANPSTNKHTASPALRPPDQEGKNLTGSEQYSAIHNVYIHKYIRTCIHTYVFIYT